MTDRIDRLLAVLDVGLQQSAEHGEHVPPRPGDIDYEPPTRPDVDALMAWWFHESQPREGWATLHHNPSIVIGEATARGGDLYAWLLEQVDGY